MEASTTVPLNSLTNPPKIDHLLKQKLLRYNVQPTPKILHNLRKKHQQKYNRKHKTLIPTETRLSEETHFQTIKKEYNKFIKPENTGKKLLKGKPWEKLEVLRLKELGNDSFQEYEGGKLNSQHLRDLSDIIECDRDNFLWVLDDDVEYEEAGEDGKKKWDPPKRSEGEAVNLLVDRLSVTDLSVKDWKFSRIMRHSGLEYTEKQMLRIVEKLGDRGKWRNALSVVEWVFGSKEHKHDKSRFVYTKLLKVLGRAREHREALRVFNFMRGDAHTYPDMAAFHSLAVTLGQGGCLKELLDVIESMKEKPQKIRNMRRKNWDPVLQPDIVIFNSVLNACVATRQWKGVSWVFQQLRKHGLRPDGPTYGLAMEVMLQSGKYDLVFEFFDKMKRSGEALKALTYKVLVRAFWQEGKVNEAVQAVRDMEERGVIGTASVYYELARCLCFYGRWEEAILEVEKIKKIRAKRPLAVTFTGMILSSLDGGHINDCLSIFEHSKTLTSHDIGIVNVMLKVYGQNDMFVRAKELFEETKMAGYSSGTSTSAQCSGLKPDSFTFSSMLETSACSHQWEYFEYVYKEMILHGYQLDQNKHSLLLVQASRSGKGHLLQHALDTILEAGEIPSMSFFMEMTYQAISQQDYERAVSIINTMAHAPFQVSFQQWIDFFEANRDRIDHTSLVELHTTLGGQDLIKEATVLNVSRALEFLCETFEDSLNSLQSAAMTDISPENVTGSSNNDHDRGGKTRLAQFDEKLEYDLVSNVMENSDTDDQDVFEQVEHSQGDSDSDEFDFEFIVGSGEDNKFREIGIPSGDKILESWKQMR